MVALMIPFAGVILKTLLGPISDLAGKYIENQTSREKFQADLEGILAVQSTELAKVQSSVIIAETQSEDWLTRMWRPITALLFVWIVFWFGWLQPASVAWWNWTPLKIGDQLLIEIVALVKLCLSGYIGGRTVEKVATTISGIKQRLQK